MRSTLIHQPRYQQTIGQPCRVSGTGYWSGRDVTVEFRPAPENSGIVFVRKDLSRAPPIPATAAYRIEMPRRTNLHSGSATVEMVEHVMAALFGLQIDNCWIGVNAPELPGCDGSSQPFVDALLTAKIVPQTAIRQQLAICQPIRVGDGAAWIEAQPIDSEGLWVDVTIDYGKASPIGRQTFAGRVEPDEFKRQLAPARTFILAEEAEWLRQRGMGTRVTEQDLLVFDHRGVVGNQLRFVDECVRHKALDLIGDLALAGCDLVGRIVAHCSGHRHNAELVKKLLQAHARAAGSRKIA
jgi:UDP-3-O-acyl N-acetylglucosamine deacetylase